MRFLSFALIPLLLPQAANNSSSLPVAATSYLLQLMPPGRRLHPMPPSHCLHPMPPIRPSPVSHISLARSLYLKPPSPRHLPSITSPSPRRLLSVFSPSPHRRLVAPKKITSLTANLLPHQSLPFATTNIGSTMLAMDLGWMCPNYSISTACAARNFYILNAANHIIRGHDALWRLRSSNHTN